MQRTDTFLAKLILRNGVLLTLPPLAISFGLWSLLPKAFGPEIFWKGIPAWLGTSENLFRMVVFSLPGFLYFGNSTRLHRAGWILYATGLLLYLGSYLLLVFFPASPWSGSLLGFTAPAWTTLPWLVGIGLVCSRSWTGVSWNSTIYVIASITFLVFHVVHTTIVFLRG